MAGTQGPNAPFMPGAPPYPPQQAPQGNPPGAYPPQGGPPYPQQPQNPMQYPTMGQAPGAAGQAGQPGPYPPQQPGPYPPQQPGPYPPQQPGPYPGGPQDTSGSYEKGFPPPQPGVYPAPAAQGAAPGSDAGTAPEDPNMVMPTAPPLSSMDQLPGYGDIGFEGASLPPPSYDEATRGPAPDREAVRGVAAVTAEDVHEALLQFVSEHCCYGKGAAERIKVRDLQSSSAFHYTLETFGESRSTKWQKEPFTGQPISVVGPPPGPWDIPVLPPTMFKNNKMVMEVPNTCSVKPCHACNARGYKRCHGCHGSSRVFCNMCSGNGWTETFIAGDRERRPCTQCGGSGRRLCYSCNGSGQIMCKVCKGRANLKWFIELTVTWTNHLDDHIVERTALPAELIRGVSGQMAFAETQPRVWPVNHFPDTEINQASNRLVSMHGSKFITERILNQRHQVRIIPVTQVSCTDEEKPLAFYVYGFENKVHFPDYPEKCCCGCSIL